MAKAFPEYIGLSRKERQRLSREKWNINNPERRREINRRHSQSPTKKIWLRDHHAQVLDSQRRSYHKNKDKRRVVDAARRAQTRSDVFERYGGKCACCGEATQEFLTIDHMNNDGGKERRALGKTGGVNFYRWLRLSGYPDGYQVLCFNCNCAKGVFGKCPHSR